MLYEAPKLATVYAAETQVNGTPQKCCKENLTGAALRLDGSTPNRAQDSRNPSGGKAINKVHQAERPGI